MMEYKGPLKFTGGDMGSTARCHVTPSYGTYAAYWVPIGTLATYKVPRSL